jgi:hypothetical protein
MGVAVRGGRHAVRPPEARREGADALQPHRRAHEGDVAVGVPQERRGALEAARQQVLVRRLAERPPELAAEVRRREVRDPCERGHVERLAVARVDEILRPQEVPSRWNRRAHRAADATRATIGSEKPSPSA